MAAVAALFLSEPVTIDPDRIRRLVSDLGEGEAERVVERAAGHIADRLARMQDGWRAADLAGIGRLSRSLIGAADQLGMYLLAHVACDVAALSAGHDPTALGAVVARLDRVGEASLLALSMPQESRL